MFPGFCMTSPLVTEAALWVIRRYVKCHVYVAPLTATAEILALVPQFIAYGRVKPGFFVWASSF